jgi:hypothetical protein
LNNSNTQEALLFLALAVLARIIHGFLRILRNAFQSNDLRLSYPFHRAGRNTNPTRERGETRSAVFAVL